MRRIYVVGALVYDIVFDVPDWVRPNRAVHASDVTLSPGGKGLNQAAAARRLGAEDVRLVGCVGADVFGDQMLEALRGAGVNVDHVRRLKSSRTSVAGIVVKDGLPGFIGAPEASRLVDDEHIDEALADLRADDVLLLGFEIPQRQVQRALRLGRAAGATTALNPAPYFTRQSFVVDYLDLVDVLIPNKAEAQLILGAETEDLDALAQGLLRRGVGAVVLTLGERGSMLFHGACRLAQPAFDLAVVDTTGASDAFVGAYCRGVAAGWQMSRTLRFASAAAGLACARRGTMTALPSLEEVLALTAKAGG